MRDMFTHKITTPEHWWVSELLPFTSQAFAAYQSTHIHTNFVS